MRELQLAFVSTCACAGLALLPTAGVAETVDWRYSMGLHDTRVPDVSSDTFGINGSLSVDKRTDGGAHYFGSFDLFVDNDHDHLDPDHIPIWWMLHAGTDGRFWQPGNGGYAGWTADLNTRMNTVSSIERQIKVLPAIVLGYDGEAFEASLKGGVGYFFQEIDDDAPKLRGFDRTGLRQTTFGESLGGRASVSLGGTVTLSGTAQEWWDSGDWLETEYGAEIRFGLDDWVRAKDSELVFSIEAHEYNLDIYPHSPTGEPVLGWNDDVMFKLSYSAVWHR
jgi:hypothetical protein